MGRQGAFRARKEADSNIERRHIAAERAAAKMGRQRDCVQVHGAARGLGRVWHAAASHGSEYSDNMDKAQAEDYGKKGNKRGMGHQQENQDDRHRAASVCAKCNQFRCY